jgi:DSF synthase
VWDDETGGGGLLANIMRRTGDTPHVGLRWESDPRILWVTFRPKPRPCFTPEVVASVLRVGEALRAMAAEAPDGEAGVHFAVFASAVPGVFNTGGDLGMFVEAIAARDEATLLRYGEAATRACHEMVDGFGAGVVTIAAVDGIALGGGFEAARCCDLVVATPRSTFQLPEARFGLHPGNGAMAVMSRRVSRATMRELVLDMRRLTASEALAAGLVDDVTTGDESAESGARRVAAALAGRRPAALALFRGAHDADGVTLDGMLRETGRWARAAARLPEADLTTMRRILAAQDRQFARRGVASAPSAGR